MTPSSKYPVRNHNFPPSMTSRTADSWHTFFQARELRFGTQVNNYISWRSMMSKIAPFSKYPVRNHQLPPSMTSRMGSSWYTTIHARKLRFGTQVRNHIRSMMSRMTPSSKYSVRNHPRPPSMTSRTGGSWHTSIHARELKFGTQIKNHILWRYMMSILTPSSKYPVRNLQCPPSITSRMGWFTSIHAR